MSVFVMFILELMTMRYARFGDGHDHTDSASHDQPQGVVAGKSEEETNIGMQHRPSHAPGDDHLGHVWEHTDNQDVLPPWQQNPGIIPEAYSAQLTSIFILEFGVIFHSIFVGLTLAVQGDGFNVLYVVSNSLTLSNTPEHQLLTHLR